MLAWITIRRLVISLGRRLSLPREGPKRVLKKKGLQFSGEGSAHSDSLNPQWKEYGHTLKF